LIVSFGVKNWRIDRKKAPTNSCRSSDLAAWARADIYSPKRISRAADDLAGSRDLSTRGRSTRPANPQDDEIRRCDEAKAP
jgi:hypothetical protein